MRKEDFRIQLIASSFFATRFAQNYVCEVLPFNFRYVVSLNESYDGNRQPDEVVYPDDNGKVLCDLSEDGVVDLLLRENRCPQWIDIAVAGASEEITLLGLCCCGRYHGDESRLYYYESGTQPFGIKSPALPPDWKEGKKFAVGRPDDAMASIIAKRRFKP
jgi:hypothetical protein